MKVTTTHASEPKFQPVAITITFESQKELDVYGSLFNTSRFNDVIRSCGVSPIEYSHLENLGAKIHIYVDKIDKEFKR